MFKLTKTQINNILKTWIPLAIITTGLCGLIYLTIQQDLRIGANDPQIQISEDVAHQIEIGQNPLTFIPPIKVDLSRSLANYIIILDNQGRVIGSSAILDGKDPIIPAGVLENTKKKGETRLTWQPKNGVRSAVVINYIKGQNMGYVIVGRSLREVEKRESNFELIIFIAWIVTLGTSLSATVLLNKLKLN